MNSVLSLSQAVAALEKKMESARWIGISGGRSISTLFEIWKPSPKREAHFFPVDERLTENRQDQNGTLIQKWVCNPWVYHSVHSLDSAQNLFTERLRGKALDLLILGVGEDGHVASLFPHSEHLDSKEEGYLAVDAALKPPHVPRLSLSPRTLSSATRCFLLFLGAEKRRAFENFMNPSVSIQDCPAKILKKCAVETVFEAEV